MMSRIRFKTFFINLIIVITVFFTDRLSKYYIVNLSKIENSVDMYVTSYLNLYLIWNKGIAFGLLSAGEGLIYNFITVAIGIIILIIFYMIWKNDNIQRFFLLLIMGGALGNFYDRLIYKAVPDFIDLHFYGYHWFVFNVADIFISIGIFCLIINELFFYKKI
ncbi:signal peptidase II [Candidatus Pelagibacter sp.]|nr:signal peptidase II [Candidatus Pelagibacter sp.]